MNGKVYGLLAEFETGGQLLAAVRRLKAEGFKDMEAYTPFPLEGLDEALGFRHNWIPLLMLLGGIIAAAGSYGLQYYSAVIDYPINSGGRPLNSWPAFIPATVELAVLGAVLAGVIGLFYFNGLPAFHHPLFDDPGFEQATGDRFFLCILAGDPRFGEAPSLLAELSPVSLREVG